jgi:hypothetical protein
VSTEAGDTTSSCHDCAESELPLLQTAVRYTTAATSAKVGLVLAAFDGAAWGDGYLGLLEGMYVTAATPPCDAQGWAFGALCDGTRGFFPPDYVRWEA